jgi:hypothetical protein
MAGEPVHVLLATVHPVNGGQSESAALKVMTQSPEKRLTSHPVVVANI